ncbi:MAG TPA: hypothetical protein VIF83_14750 [Gemmatimonadaceae bacterium]|jgi:hypothetical protein
MTSDTAVIPISDLFYDDAGPHIVSAGAIPLNPARFSPARGRELQDLLGASIAQLGAVSGIRRTPASALVPIENLVYRGRAALERAIEIGQEARDSGTLPTPDKVEELLDLIQLAVEE